MSTLSRRDVLKVGGATVAAGTLLTPARARAAGPAPTTVTITGSCVGVGTYDYHPFTMPDGVNRLDVKLTKLTTPTKSAVGLGIFDTRGSHYGTAANPNGFRGIFGEERSQFTITAASATNAFIPGPLPAGDWTLVVPVFTVGPQMLSYQIDVTMSHGAPATPAFTLGADLLMVKDEPGWYRGDLHCHTQASSDALSSGSAMLPAQWAQACQRLGLNFVALTDHNVVNQNFAIAAAAAGTDVLVMAGEEMTNWFWGHATVSGMSPGDWLDWRQLPADQATGAALDPQTGKIQDFVAHARSLGAFISVAHPLGATLAWRFFGDAASDPAARTDSLEVWTGPFQPDDQASVNTWDSMLVAGQRIVANGGSDLHGVNNTGGVAVGTPTTVIHSQALGKTAVVAALKAGRSFITRVPMGAEAYLSVENPNGAQRQIMGGTVYGAATDMLAITVETRRAAGLRLVLIRDAAIVSTTVLTDADQTVVTSMPLTASGYYRAELRGTPSVDPTNPTAGRLDMEALTNPVWLVLGAVPDGTTADTTQAPPPDGNSQPVLPDAGTPVLLPLTGLAVGMAAAFARRRNRPRAMTHTEFGLLASDPTWAELAELTGEVTAFSDTVVTITRWVPGCCSTEACLHILVTGAPADLLATATLGQWWTVTGRATVAPDVEAPPRSETDGHAHAPRPRPPVLAAATARVRDPLPRLEV